MPASTTSQMQMPREPAPAAFPAERTSTEQPVCETFNLRDLRIPSKTALLVNKSVRTKDNRPSNLLTVFNSARFNP